MPRRWKIFIFHIIRLRFLDDPPAELPCYCVELQEGDNIPQTLKYFFLARTASPLRCPEDLLYVRIDCDGPSDTQQSFMYRVRNHEKSHIGPKEPFPACCFRG
jgi:hypothetical protein